MPKLPTADWLAALADMETTLAATLAELDRSIQGESELLRASASSESKGFDAIFSQLDGRLRNGIRASQLLPIWFSSWSRAHGARNCFSRMERGIRSLARVAKIEDVRANGRRMDVPARGSHAKWQSSSRRRDNPRGSADGRRSHSFR